MKKIIVAMLALLLMAALAMPALAYWGTLYANKSSVKVYYEDDTDSGVMYKVKGGTALEVGALSPDGKWAQLEYGGYVQMKYLSKTLNSDYCSHDWSKWKVTREATCTENGKRTRTCYICGKTKTETIKATGHEWGKWKVTKEATCSVKGKRTRTCKVCGKKETEEYYADHTYGSWQLTKESTCTEMGERERTCKVCGRTETQALDMLPHEYEWKVVTEPTDHSAGTRAKVCVNCGYETSAESFDPEGTLRRGDRGEAVYNMQQLLVEQNYLNAGGADGIFGGGSEKALMKYQQDRGLNPDGVAWPQTLKDLEHDFGPWETVKEMTRTEDGIRVRVCQGCGFEQRETIASGDVLEKGSRGENVRALQQIVKELGYDAGGFDGIYGRKLDSAMAGFAADHGFEVEEGEIRPGDMDALISAWLAQFPADHWKGESDLDTDVNLALTVTETGEPDDSGIVTYNWSLTNLGEQNATFTALLLSYGDAPDFKKDIMVMQLDGVVLKGDSGNSASGSFSASEKWGEGNLNFAAIAMDERSEDLWLSNTVTFEVVDASAAKTVAPYPVELNVNALEDGEYPVAFNPGDVLAGASGIYMNAVQVYTRDWYDIVDVNTLKVGDTIIVEGEEVPVLTLAETEYGILVNEDQDARAFYLVSEEDSNGFAVQGLNDLGTYTPHGMTSLVLDESAVFNDAWDIENGPVTVAYDGIVAAISGSENTYFTPYNTTVRIENGRVVEINRVYVA